MTVGRTSRKTTSSFPPPYLRYKKRVLDWTKMLTRAVSNLKIRAGRLERTVAELTPLVTRDALTGLYNRRATGERFLEQIAAARRYSRGFSVLMVDIDNFKRVNDAHSHEAGDQALQKVAEALVSNARTTDFVGRWGGEEFVLLLPETTIKGALVLAERLRANIASKPIELELADRPKVTIDLTVSIGVMAFNKKAYKKNKTDAEVAAAFMARVDQALYAAKDAGRNQVRRYED